MNTEMDMSRQAIIDAATAWFVRSRDTGLTPSEREEFAQWLKESPLHVQEYLAIARIWGDVTEIEGAVATAEQLTAPEIADNVISLSEKTGKGEYAKPAQAVVPEKPGQRLRPHRRGKTAVAASLLAAISLAAVSWWQGGNAMKTHETSLGEQRSLVLEDGSVVEMNTASQIDVEFDSANRTVTLVAGEVFFDVRKDAARPFVVRVGESEIRVLGTKFNVYMQEKETSVTVLEGNVSVSTGMDLDDAAEFTGAIAVSTLPQLINNESVLLKSGEQAVIHNETRKITTVTLPDSEKFLAWTDRRLILDETRLDEILAEFTRYNDVRFTIANEEVAKLRFTGVFDAQDMESFISYLEFHSDVSVVKQNGVIVVGSLP
ncbi:MAG: FecR family protein [Halieaceae bacterium]|nr:FecR family protein [Halieaceae bacterium]